MCLTVKHMYFLLSLLFVANAVALTPAFVRETYDMRLMKGSSHWWRAVLYIDGGQFSTLLYIRAKDNMTHHPSTPRAVVGSSRNCIVQAHFNLRCYWVKLEDLTVDKCMKVYIISSIAKYQY